MALSAFKSSPKRANRPSSSRSTSSLKDHPLENPWKRIPTRRSRSVSAVSRSSDVSQFSNTRDNPLYSSSSSSQESESAMESFKGGPDSSDITRGRSISRENNGNYESEVEGGFGSGSNLRSKAVCMYDASTTKSDDAEETMSLRKWTDQHPIPESWETSSARNWEERISTSSLSEAEDMSIRAPFRGDHTMDDDGAGGIYETVRSEVRRVVCEIRNDLENAIRRKNPATITTENIVDIPQELMNADAFEFASVIRKEYATKLEQSQERARKLRADLAVEEQRGQELSQILKEMVSDSKSSATGKPRPRRKASIERLKMSRRLAEEAMNYFDECVSISTFDSSDFSSIEDPQHGLAASIPQMGSSRFFPTEASTSSASRTATGCHNHHEESDYQTPCSLSIAESDLVELDTPQSRNLRFSFAREPMEAGGVKDIRHYIKKFGKEFRKEGIECVKVRSSYSADDYDLNWSAESLLFDIVMHRNRLESGGLLLCDIRIF